MKRYQNFPVVLSCSVVSVETALKILVYFSHELCIYGTTWQSSIITEWCYILKSLLCYLLKNERYNFCPYFCCSFSSLHFWEEDGAGEFALFWPTIVSLGWGICTFLNQDDFPGAGYLNKKTDLSSNLRPMPGLSPRSSLTLIGA